MIWRQIYLCLGGNLGDSRAVLMLALQYIEAMRQVRGLKVSRFYRTTPVSDVEQGMFVNVVCGFETSMDARTLFDQLEKIEVLLGKIPKPKNAARRVDIDFLFYGTERYVDATLEIPHPRWRERLFVIKPLSDIVKRIMVPDPVCVGKWEDVDLEDLLRTFPNKCGEKVALLSERKL